MLHSGVTRTMDDLGRIVIPKVYRNAVGAKEGDSFELHVDENNRIVLTLVTKDLIGPCLRRIENALGGDGSPEATQIRKNLFQIWEVLNSKNKGMEDNHNDSYH